MINIYGYNVMLHWTYINHKLDDFDDLNLSITYAGYIDYYLKESI